MDKEMETITKTTDKKKVTEIKKTQRAPLSVTVQTSNGGILSMKQITPSEIKALRNPAYKYLA